MSLPSLRHFDPSSRSLNSKERSFAAALKLFHEAAERVPAYKDFLRKESVRHESVRSESDFAQVPLIDKTNYFSQYDLKAMSWDGTHATAKYVSMSSGSTGVPFFWPRGEHQDVTVGLMTQRLYEDIFGAKKGTTLFVNSFSLGAWIAGMEFFNSVRWAAEHGTRITVVTPGIDKVEAINQIKKLAPHFSRVILAGYPPFVKDILDHGVANGIDWKDIDLKLLFAGESVSEDWKDRILAHAGRHPRDLSRVVNIYGMAESGVVAHTTPVSTLLRRHLKEVAQTVPGLPDPNQVMGMYQYYPLARYFEVVDGNSIVLTANAGLPLIRCGTRDNGGILWQDVLAHDPLKKLARQHGVRLSRWQLPLIYLSGRKDLSISFYALNIYVENVKYALEHSAYASELSGFFTMTTRTAGLDQRFEIAIELSKRAKRSATLAKQLSDEIAVKISRVNSEYAKLRSAIGDRAKPHVTLAPLGEIQVIPGKKHKWVKRG